MNSGCGSTWYEPQISGSSTTYIVVNPRVESAARLGPRSHSGGVGVASILSEMFFPNAPVEARPAANADQRASSFAEHETMNRALYATAMSLVCAMLLLACASEPASKAPQNWDGLEKRDVKDLDAVYVRAGYSERGSSQDLYDRRREHDSRHGGARRAERSTARARGRPPACG